VLSGHPDVSQKMRARVLAAVEEIGYEPDFLARSLRRGATMTVGFIVSDVSNPLISEIALGAEVTLSAAGYSMVLANAQNDSTREIHLIRLLHQRRIDGLLLSLADETHKPTRDALRRLRRPFVLLDREVPDLPNAGAVLSDHRSGVRAAAEYLAQLGHRRIGLITGSDRVRHSRERIAGLHDACINWPELQPIVSSGSLTAAHGAAASTSMLGRPDPPTALIVGGNQLLPGVLSTLRARNLKVPDDVSLVVCDRVPLAEFLEPPIAVIAREPDTMGRVGAELLLRQMRGEEPRTVTLPVTFTPTVSCAAPRLGR
jgi:LacI family transcriptional regulator